MSFSGIPITSFLTSNYVEPGKTEGRMICSWRCLADMVEKHEEELCNCDYRLVYILSKACESYTSFSVSLSLLYSLTEQKDFSRFISVAKEKKRFSREFNLSDMLGKSISEELNFNGLTLQSQNAKCFTRKNFCFIVMNLSIQSKKENFEMCDFCKMRTSEPFKAC